VAVVWALPAMTTPGRQKAIDPVEISSPQKYPEVGFASDSFDSIIWIMM